MSICYPEIVKTATRYMVGTRRLQFRTPIHRDAWVAMIGARVNALVDDGATDGEVIDWLQVAFLEARTSEPAETDGKGAA